MASRAWPPSVAARLAGREETRVFVAREGMIAAVHVRVCVDCNEEYRPEVARCADCGGDLQDRHDDEGSGEASTLAHADTDFDRPLPDAHALATSADARELVPLADRLVAAGLQFRIVAREVAGESRPHGFELRVTDVDRSAALAAVAALVEPGSGVTLLVMRALPASDDEHLRCPACDTPVAASSLECSECGLGLEGEREA